MSVIMFDLPLVLMEHHEILFFRHRFVLRLSGFVSMEAA